MSIKQTRITIAGLALCAFPLTARAQQFPASQPFPSSGEAVSLGFTGAPEDFKIPPSGAPSAVRLRVKGGRGGGANPFDNHCESSGGRGALLTADFLVGTDPGELAPGGWLRFIVGEAGTSDNEDGAFAAGGGGGGSGVLYRAPGSSTWEPLLVAGGGGGAGQAVIIWACEAGNNGVDASLSPNGTPGNNSKAGLGGTDGNGGEPSFGPGNKDDEKFGGGGGGGLYGSVETGSPNINGAKGYPAGGVGGSNDHNGGWGCGGGGSGFSTSGTDLRGAGGGGGYSGGGGGGKTDMANRPQGGGGGGSFIASYAEAIHQKLVYTGATVNGFASLQSLGPAVTCSQALDLFASPVQNSVLILNGAIFNEVPSVTDSCAFGAGAAGPDVWYRFTNDLPLDRILTFENFSALDLSMEQHTACGGAEPLVCGDPDLPEGAVFTVPANETRYFRIETPQAGFVSGASFGLQISVDAIGSDIDGDSVLDWFDLCVGDDTLDFDGDGIPNDCETCFGSGPDCNLNGVDDTCDTNVSQIRYQELFNDSLLPGTITTGNDYTPAFVANALRIGGETDVASFGNVTFEPLTPVPVEQVEFMFWIRCEPAGDLLWPVSFKMFDADEFDTGTPVTGPNDASGVVVSWDYDLSLSYEGTFLTSVQMPFEFDDATWRQFRVRMYDGEVSVGYREVGEGFFTEIMAPVALPGWTPFRARYGVGAYSFPDILEHEILVDQVFIQDLTAGFDMDLDNDGALDSCEPLVVSNEVGVPANPDVLGTVGFTAPVMGADYTLSVDHSAFHTGAALDFLYVSALQVNEPSPFGTLLMSWPAPFGFAATAGESFDLTIPYSPAIYDLPLTFQALSWDPTDVGSEFLFTNAVVAPIAGWRQEL